MAGVCKRESDKARGKAGKWTAWWKGEDGRQRTAVAFVDRAKSLEFAQARETEAKRVREGLADPAERSRRAAAFKPVAAHVADYALTLKAKGVTPKHWRDVRTALTDLFADASVAALADLEPARVQMALERLRARRSARTCNKAVGFVKAFAAWLWNNGRVRDPLRGVADLKGGVEAADRRRVRRALTPVELVALIAAAEAGPPLGVKRSRRTAGPLTGPQRAAVYRLAAGTGFRAREISTLTPERFALDGPVPAVTVRAGYAKNRKEAVQAITLELAERLRPFVEGRPPGVPVFPLPRRTAGMVEADLKAAGIDATDAAGTVVDFHAIRHTFISRLIETGANPKVAQTLARHSTPVLTIGRYTHATQGDLRAALDKAV